MGEPVSISLPDAIAAFVADLELQGRTATARTYGHTLAPVARLESLTAASCRELIRDRASQVQPSSLVTFVAVLRSFCTWMVAQGYLAQNPTDGIPKPKQRRPPHRFLTSDKLRAMYEACESDTDRLIVALCGGSGLRAGELIDLKWRDVGETTIRVLGKSRKWRELAPGAVAMGLLSAQERRGAYVMPFRATDTLRYRVRALARRIGIGACTTHMLRHSFAVAWLEATGDAFTLQTLLGHASPIMTGYYVRTVRESAGVRKQSAVDLGSKLFGKSAQ